MNWMGNMTYQPPYKPALCTTSRTRASAFPWSGLPAGPRAEDEQQGGRMDCHRGSWQLFSGFGVVLGVKGTSTNGGSGGNSSSYSDAASHLVNENSDFANVSATWLNNMGPGGMWRFRQRLDRKSGC
jgi:hypothetical protein